MTGLITQYLGSGLAAARPATPDVPTGALAFYFATDTEALSMYDQNDGAWQTTGGSGDLLAANNLSDVASAATAATNLGLGTGSSPQFTAINLGHASDTTLTRVSAGVIAVEGATVATLAGGTFTGDIVVPDEAYDATAWNGSLEVPTKNAVRDKIEALSSGVASGSSFPGSPASGDRFWRTDLKMAAVYDGTRWLSENIYIADYSTTTAAHISATGSHYIGLPFYEAYDIYVEKASISANQQTATTNTTVSYYVFQFFYRTAAGAAVALGSTFSTQGSTLLNWSTGAQDINTVVDITGNNKSFQVTSTLTGTAQVAFSAAFSYRLVLV